MVVAYNDNVDIRLRIGFDSNPTESVFTTTWTDVTDDLRAWEAKIGKQHELGRFEAAEGKFVLDNRSGDYDPTNNQGAHFPDVKIDRRINMQATHSVTFANLDGSGGVTTADKDQLDIVGDIDIRGFIQPDDVTPTSQYTIISKWGLSNQISWWFRLRTDGGLDFFWSPDGIISNVASSTQTLPDVNIPNNFPVWVRVIFNVDVGGTGHTVQFAFSGDGISWENFGEVFQGVGVTSIFNSTTPVIVGALSGFTSNRFNGRIYSAEVRNGISGSLVAHPDFRVVDDTATSFTDDQGNLWFLEGTTDFQVDGIIFDLYNGFIKVYRQVYPTKMAGLGKGDTFTVIDAVDSFNFLARTRLHDSVYTHTIQDFIDTVSTEVTWYRLDEDDQINIAVNSGPGKLEFDGTYDTDVSRGQQSLVFLSPNNAVQLTMRDDTEPESDKITIPRIVNDYPFTVEFFMRVEGDGVLGLEPEITPFVGNPLPPPGQTLVGQNIYMDTIGSIIMNVDDGPNRRRGATDRALDDNQIHHVACRFASATDFRIWIDGQEDTVTFTTEGNGAPVVVTGQPWVIGPQLNPPVPVEPYLMDEVTIFADLALTPATIVDHAVAGIDTANGQRPQVAWGNEFPNVRINRILDFAGFPAADRNLNQGTSLLQPTELGGNALEYLQKVEETDFGALWQTQAGNIEFLERETIFAGSFRTNIIQATFGDGFTAGVKELGYTELSEPVLDDTGILNVATVARDRGPERHAVNEVSKGEHQIQDFTATDLLHASDLVSQDYANFIVNNFGEPNERIEKITVDMNDPDVNTIRQRILERRIMDRVRVKRRPPSGQEKVIVDALILNIEQKSTASSKEWTTEYQITTLGEISNNFWLLGITDRSELGQNTLLGF